MPRHSPLLLALAASIAACASPVNYVDPPLPPARALGSGTLEPQGVVIGAVDGSFALEGGKPWKPPFVVELPEPVTRADATGDDAEARWLGCLASRYETTCDRHGGLARAWPAFLKAGARAVQILVPGRPQPLAGVLYLGEIPKAAGGTSSKQYRVVLTADAVEAADAGRVGVIFGQGLVPDFGWVKSWVLWVSATPLTPPPSDDDDDQP